MQMIKSFLVFVLAILIAMPAFAQNRQRVEVNAVKMDVQYRKIGSPEKLHQASEIVKVALKEECSSRVCSAVPYAKFQKRVRTDVGKLGGLEVERVDFVKY